MTSRRKDELADVGMIGLGVMGSNLALNMADHRFRVAGQERTFPIGNLVGIDLAFNSSVNGLHGNGSGHVHYENFNEQ